MDNRYFENRIWYFDYLRIFASFCVILLHTAALNWYSLDVASAEWQILNIYDSIVRWVVPVFLMVSGAVMLSRDIPIKQLYRKYIRRMVYVYVVWSLVYTIDTYWGTLMDDRHAVSKAKILETFIRGKSHMWFLPLICGMYIMQPLMRKIVQDLDITRYFLKVGFVVTFLFPFVVDVTKVFLSGHIVTEVTAMTAVLNNAHLTMVSAMPFYYVLGYYLQITNYKTRSDNQLFMIGFISFLMMIVLTSAASLQKNTPIETFYSNRGLLSLWESIFIFGFFQKYYNKIPKMKAIVTRLSKDSFGVYLVHYLVIFKFYNAGVFAWNLPYEILIPVIAIMVCMVSYFIADLLNRIPIFREFV